MSDSDQGQRNIEANVTVLVKRLTPNDVRSVIPITLTSHSQSLVRPQSEVGHAHCGGCRDYTDIYILLPFTSLIKFLLDIYYHKYALLHSFLFS